MKIEIYRGNIKISRAGSLSRYVTYSTWSPNWAFNFYLHCVIIATDCDELHKLSRIVFFGR